MKQRELFGTDGIRGVANKYPMTPDIALNLGKAVAKHFTNGKAPKIVVGKDTRLSGYLFENAITAGLVSRGATVFLVGPLPTPAVAHITRSFKADAGIMITASHNPASHNGIKIFDQDGGKLPDSAESEIEKSILSELEKCGHSNGEALIGKARRIDDARGRYIEFAKATIQNKSLQGLKVLLDCANGAAYSVTPVILKELGAEVISRNVTPDGLNINKACGALFPEALSSAVKEESADVGIALDGDADRLIMVDERGKLVDGDHLLAILALDLNARGKLLKKIVVGTQYTNRGFDEAMSAAGISVLRVENGDRYILEKLNEEGLNLGGEQSGHIIMLDHATTGDGTIAALHILRIMKDREETLSKLATCMKSWPQETRSYEVNEKRGFEKLPLFSAARVKVENILGDNGRLFVRYSGTEFKIRLMIEAKEGPFGSLFDQLEEALRREGILAEEQGKEREL